MSKEIKCITTLNHFDYAKRWFSYDSGRFGSLCIAKRETRGNVKRSVIKYQQTIKTTFEFQTGVDNTVNALLK